MNQFTETTSRSWFQRMGGGVTAILVGLVLVLGSLVALFVNEGRAVTTAKALSQGAGSVISVSASNADPANEGKLVHISGPVQALGTPRDTETGMSAEGAVRLQRIVEMYQWVEKSKTETRTKLGGGEETVTTYEYVREWSQREIKSSGFRQQAGHENPPFPISSAEFDGDGAMLGAFRLSASQAAGISSSAPVTPDATTVARLRAGIGAGRAVQAADGVVSVSLTPSAPSVGDVRIRYEARRPDRASFVAEQSGAALKPFQITSNRTIFLSQRGEHLAAEMFEAAQSANTALTWGLRLGGLLALFIGFRLMFSILGVIGDVIPFIGRLVRAGTGLIAFFLTALLGSVAIALGWIAYRPLIGGTILLAGFALAYFAWSRSRKAEPAGQTAAAQ